MIYHVLEGIRSSFEWIDVVEPTKEELESLGRKYGLHHTSIVDCLDPTHLPKFELLSQVSFLILRGYDHEADASETESVQAITRKVALFMGPDFVMTVHRRDLPYIGELRNTWRSEQHDPKQETRFILVAEILKACALSYETAVVDSLQALEAFESKILQHNKGSIPLIEEGYFLRRKASVFKRMLRMTIDVIAKFPVTTSGHVVHFQDAREQAERVYFYADELLDNCNQMLNMHISISSQRTNDASFKTNEVMRVLTIFSIFFMPLNLIAGIYGMNFEHMPELKDPWAYPIVLFMMGFLSLVIFIYVRRKGWLNPN